MGDSRRIHDNLDIQRTVVIKIGEKPEETHLRRLSIITEADDGHFGGLDNSY